MTDTIFIAKRFEIMLLPGVKLGLKRGLGEVFRRLPGSSLSFGPPRNFAATASQWYGSLSAGEKLKHSFRLLSPEAACDRTVPVFADEPLRQMFQQMREGRYQSRFVASIEKGRYWGRCYGYVIAPGDILISDLSPTFADYGMPLARQADHDAFSCLRLPPVKEIQGTVLALNTLFCENFHHFLLDTLPKIDLLIRSGVALSSVDYFVFDYRNKPYQNQALERLGIGRERIICSTSGLHLEAARLVVPSYSEPGARVAAYQYSREGLEFVRNLFLDAPPTGSRRILVSRRLAGCRRWIHEEEALPLLRKAGFELVELETLTVSEQARLFSQAEIIIMPHGGGLANCVFCSPGTQVVELFSPSYLPTFMMPLSCAMGLKYHALIGGDHPVDIDVPAQRVVDYVSGLF